jgi:serine/threonine protein kinase/WD40 repeat protein
MKRPAQLVNAISSTDQALGLLIDELTARIQAGELVDVEAYAADHPEHAEALRRLVPALHLLADLGRSAPVGSASGTCATAHADGLTGRLGDFRLLREVGRGGMGVVYEAEQISLGRRVALKVLPFAAALDPKHLQRFKNEAQAAAHLQHQHIVPVYYVGFERGVHFYAMQFIDGHTLAAVIRELRRLAGQEPAEDVGEARALASDLASGRWAALKQAPTGERPTGPSSPGAGLLTTHHSPLTNTLPVAALSTERSTASREFFRTVANLGVQAAVALEHAHQLGVVHRDIKPANLMVDGLGNLWVTDFGLARLQGDAGLTMSGDLLGTIRYMSPEQALAKRVLVDHRTDVYSLGVTLYELLTLQPAFNGRDREEVLRQIAFEEPRPPRRLNPAVPLELETIVLKAIAKNPAERYSTGQELADDLERFLADKPIRARRASVWEKARRWRRRNPTVAFLSGLVVLLLMLMGAGLLVGSLLNQERKAALHAKEDARAAEQLAKARASRWSGQVGQRFKSLEALTEAARLRPSLELRNDAIACLTLADLRLAKELPGGFPPGTTQVAFDASFERYARGDEKGNLSIRQVVDDREIIALPGPEDYPVNPVSILQFSPDGQFLVAMYPASTVLRVWNWKKGEVVVARYSDGSFAFSPDSRWVAINGNRNEGDISVKLYELSGGTRKNFLSPDTEAGCLAFHPDGRRLAICFGREVRIYDLDSGVLKQTLNSPMRLYAVCWHPRGTFVAAGCFNDHSIVVWDAATGREQAVLKGTQMDVRSVAFSHRGDLLASLGDDGTLALWNPFTGRQLLTQEGGISAQFSPDDRLLGPTRSGSNLQLWEVVSGTAECQTLRGPLGEANIWTGHLSPDGRFLASVGLEGVRWWDLAAVQESALLPRGFIYVVLFHPSGDSLFTSGLAGLYRWPIRPARASGGGALQIGPPQPLHVPTKTDGISLSADGRLLAVADTHNSQAILFDLETGKKTTLGTHRDIGKIAISPDGHWVATVPRTFEASTVKIWDAQRRTFAQDLPGYPVTTASLAFSGKGRWLGTGALDDYRLWQVGSWQQERVIPRDHATGIGHLAFTADEKLLAIAHSDRLVRLVDPSTGEELDLYAQKAQILFAFC